MGVLSSGIVMSSLTPPGLRQTESLKDLSFINRHNNNTVWFYRALVAT